MKTFIRILAIIFLIPTLGIVLMVVAAVLLGNHGLEAENARLKTQLQVLEAKIDFLENEPQALFSKAIDLKNRNKIDTAISTLHGLKEKHPGFKADEVRHSLSQLEKLKIKQEEEVANRKRLEAEEKEKQRLAEERSAEERKRKLAETRKEHERAMAEATRNLVKTTDEVNEIEWYYDKSSPRTNNAQNIQAYIGKKGRHVWLRFKMSYSARDWLFVESAIFKVDEMTCTVPEVSTDRWEGDHQGGKIWEWKDMKVDDRTWQLIRKIAESDKTLLRYKGRQYSMDREITESEKQALRNIILSYEAMGGTPPNR